MPLRHRKVPAISDLPGEDCSYSAGSPRGLVFLGPCGLMLALALLRRRTRTP